MLNMGGKALVHYEPFGVILDIGAWNYPVQIPVSTMINIIAAGTPVFGNLWLKDACDCMS